jgi:hypothetical protein
VHHFLQLKPGIFVVAASLAPAHRPIEVLTGVSAAWMVCAFLTACCRLAGVLRWLQGIETFLRGSRFPQFCAMDAAAFSFISQSPKR